MIGNDVFAQLPLLFCKGNGFVAISDSVFILTQLRRHFGIKNKVNIEAALSRAWIHGMGSQVLGTNTQVEGLSFCPPGSKIRCRMSGDKLISHVEKVLVTDLFPNEAKDYREALREGARRVASVVASLPGIPQSHTRIEVSGGTDSRIGLAAALKFPDPSVFSFHTNKDSPEDYAVAQRLSEKFMFSYGLRKGSNPPGIPKSVAPTLKGQIPIWYLSSAGIYDPLYSPRSIAGGPPVEIGFSIGGYGAEVCKGLFRWRPLSAMTPDKVGHAAAIQSRIEKPGTSFFSRKARSISKMLNSAFGITEHRVGKEISEAMYREASAGLHSVGICPENPWASEWHNLCFRNAIFSGRSTIHTLLNLSPLLQPELLGLSYSELNPYPAPKDGSPSIMTDMLIALNPELAMMPFDDPAKNLSEAYVRERSDYLGHVSDVEPYSIVGDPRSVSSGTPVFFQDLVRASGFEGDFSPESVKQLAREGYACVPESIRHAYALHMRLVENELPSRITIGSWVCKAAGKLMAFLLTRS